MLTSKILGLRPTPENLARVDRLASALTRSMGVEVRRGGVAMSALLTGLDALERQHGLAKEAAAPYHHERGNLAKLENEPSILRVVCPVCMAGVGDECAVSAASAVKRSKKGAA